MSEKIECPFCGKNVAENCPACGGTGLYQVEPVEIENVADYNAAAQRFLEDNPDAIPLVRSLQYQPSALETNLLHRVLAMIEYRMRVETGDEALTAVKEVQGILDHLKKTLYFNSPTKYQEMHEFLDSIQQPFEGPYRTLSLASAEVTKEIP